MLNRTPEEEIDHNFDLLSAELRLRVIMQQKPISYWEQGALLYKAYKDRFTKTEIEYIIDVIWDTWDKNDEYIDSISKFIRERKKQGESRLVNSNSEETNKESSAS